jgi:beta-galactosidase
MRDIRLFNDAWEFTKLRLGEQAAAGNVPAESMPPAGSEWLPVEIPHDWLIGDTGNLYESGIGWYRKSFDLPPLSDGLSAVLRFEGVYMDSSVFVNGKRAGEWKNGYTTFEIDLSPFARAGGNEVVVRVVHLAPNSRWYSGAGIYRNVWLKILPAARIVSDGVYVSTRKGPEGWSLSVDTEFDLGAGPGGYSLRHAVCDAEGREIAVSERGLEPGSGPGTDARSMPVRDPALWDIESPCLHTLKTTLLRGGLAVDEEIRSFGFREIAFDPRRGFSLNGRRVRFKGVCQHHDLGCLGAAVNKAALRRQLVLLKEMGANAIRSSHNPPAVELMDLADEMGVLILSEIFDMWEEPKNRFDDARFFRDWARRDVEAWVRRDRNRPSLVMWSIGNEIHDTHAGERGLEITAALTDMVKAHDPRGNAQVTLCSNYMPWEGAQKCADLVKLAGYNYGIKYYAKHHAEHPDWLIYGSETGSVVQSRGIYHFPAAKSILADDDLQCSSLGNSSTSWGAKSAESCLIDDRDAEFSLGQFIWSGFDYIGEPTPYHTRNSYFGQLDTCGFPKDSYYVYQAEWTDFRAKPMIHLFPYWDFNDGQLIDLRVCSNAPAVELFLDGRSLGRTEIDHAKGKKLIAEYQVPFKAGELRAVAYDESGKVIAEERKRSFGDAASLELKADKATMAADGRDLAFIEVSARDAQGVAVENASSRVSVSVSGAGRLVGLDNGDSADSDQYSGSSKRLFSGKLLAVVAARLEPGEVRVEVSSIGMEPQVLRLHALPCAGTRGVSALRENRKDGPNPEIPVRKISIDSPSGTRLGPGLRSVVASARISPADSSYRDLEWRATDDSGIDTIVAKLEPKGSQVTVTAVADGAFRLRCSSRNGSDGIRLISTLEFESSGLGKAFIDPYHFVSGGMCNASNAELGNGNDHGVATLRDGESHVGFRDVDFGDFGSDEVTVPIFELDSRPLAFQVWEGMPGEADSALLADEVYDKKSIWNTYQEETFKLSRRMRGVTTLCFVTDHKAHIKGFAFKRLEKAFARLQASENDRVYGDAFTVAGGAVEGIGNNVTLEFGGMDFGPGGTTGIRIRGRSRVAKNTIHIRFEGEGGNGAQIAEFPFTEGRIEMEFPLERVSGKQRVSFVFLPGSSFDFESFQFLA